MSSTATVTVTFMLMKKQTRFGDKRHSQRKNAETLGMHAAAESLVVHSQIAPNFLPR